MKVWLLLGLCAALIACGKAEIPTSTTVSLDAITTACIAQFNSWIEEFDNLSPEERLEFDDPLRDPVYDANDYTPWELFALDRGYPLSLARHCPNAPTTSSLIGQ